MMAAPPKVIFSAAAVRNGVGGDQHSTTPSSRTLFASQAWNDSFGITFASKGHSRICDQTWNPSKGVVFAKRHYRATNLNRSSTCQTPLVIPNRQLYSTAHRDVKTIVEDLKRGYYKTTKELDQSGALSPFAADIQRQCVEHIKEQLISHYSVVRGQLGHEPSQRYREFVWVCLTDDARHQSRKKAKVKLEERRKREHAQDSGSSSRTVRSSHHDPRVELYLLQSYERTQRDSLHAQSTIACTKTRHQTTNASLTKEAWQEQVFRLFRVPQLLLVDEKEQIQMNVEKQNSVLSRQRAFPGAGSASPMVNSALKPVEHSPPKQKISRPREAGKGATPPLNSTFTNDLASGSVQKSCQIRLVRTPKMSTPHPTHVFIEPHMTDECSLEANNGMTSTGSGPSEPSTASKMTGKSDGGDKSRACKEQPNLSIKKDITKEPSDSEPGDGESGNGSQEESTSESEDEAQEKHIPLSFQIPPEALRATMQASPNTDGRYWRHDLYRGPDDQKISVHYCRNMEIAERVAKYFLEEKVVGFDIEWKPHAHENAGIKVNASLIQLACEDRIALFHLSLFKGTTVEELMPPTLKQVLESPKIMKVGVAVGGDFTRLKKYLGIEARGQFELSRLHRLVKFSVDQPKEVNKRLVALAKQVEEHLQLPLSKGPVRESDWSKALSYEQILYAASDAYAGFRIFDVLEAKRKMLRPTPPRPHFSELDVPTRRPKRVRTVSKEEEVSEDDAKEYETAAEELMDSQELEASSEAKSSAESSNQSDDPGGDYVPSTRHVGRLSMGSSDDTTDGTLSPTKRVGRIRLLNFAGPDPCYPTLPGVSSDDGNEPASKSLTSKSTSTSKVTKRIGKIDFENPPLSKPETGKDEDDEWIGLASILGVGEQKDLKKGKSATARQGPEDGESRSALRSANPIQRNEKGKGRAKIDQTVTLQPSNQKPVPNHEPTPPPQFQPLQPETPLKSPEYLEAELWAQTYLFSIPSANTSNPSRIRATIPHLRAYHLWHHQNMPLPVIAQHLRDPPLAQSTVSNYILQTVMLEMLEYRVEDLRGLLRTVPRGLRMGRFRWLVEKVDGLGG